MPSVTVKVWPVVLTKPPLTLQAILHSSATKLRHNEIGNKSRSWRKGWPLSATVQALGYGPETSTSTEVAQGNHPPNLNLNFGQKVNNNPRVI